MLALQACYKAHQLACCAARLLNAAGGQRCSQSSRARLRSALQAPQRRNRPTRKPMCGYMILNGSIARPCTAPLLLSVCQSLHIPRCTHVGTPCCKHVKQQQCCTEHSAAGLAGKPAGEWGSWRPRIRAGSMARADLNNYVVDEKVGGRGQRCADQAGQAGRVVDQRAQLAERTAAQHGALRVTTASCSSLVFCVKKHQNVVALPPSVGVRRQLAVYWRPSLTAAVCCMSSMGRHCLTAWHRENPGPGVSMVCNS